MDLSIRDGNTTDGCDFEFPEMDALVDDGDKAWVQEMRFDVKVCEKPTVTIIYKKKSDCDNQNYDTNGDLPLYRAIFEVENAQMWCKLEHLFNMPPFPDVEEDDRALEDLLKDMMDGSPSDDISAMSANGDILDYEYAEGEDDIWPKRVDDGVGPQKWMNKDGTVFIGVLVDLPRDNEDSLDFFRRKMNG